ncbi:Heavy metal-associated domain superfamily [Arabidopsis suecica]|uniref:Heavy metal-associated domain superfamily n=1 Tax=Arabidopsis suecica TaxID=45249 RepID=A0A8T1Z8I8_ARASU|nr:Heavy metal-associated domain superfamily [Arabidopsis suecica]
MASIAASSTFHSFCTTKSPNLSSTHLLPLSKNLNFRTRAIGNSRICSFAGFMKQNRLGLMKLSSVGEGGEGVAVAEEQQQETVSVPVSPSDMLTMFFQADGTLNEAAIPNVTRALQDIDGVSNLKVQVSEGVAVVELSKQTTVQATGVASSLVETIQGAGFKLQTLNLSFEDEDEVLV